MVDYITFELEGYISLDEGHKMVAEAADVLCNKSTGYPTLPFHWEKLSWYCEKLIFNKYNGYFHILNDGCSRKADLLEFFSFIKPALLAEKGSVVGWYVCESDDVKHELVV